MERSCEVHASGSDAIVVRRAAGPDAARLRATGERLAAASHPGVVEVVSSQGTDEEWELTLVHAGRPIDIVGPLAVKQIAGITAALATTLADLHAVGIVHGSVESSHVLIGAHGRPVLCGFGQHGSAAAAPEDDVAAVGALMVELLGSEPDPDPIPERRWSRRGRWNGWARRSLLLVADQACAEPATRRPTARRLASQIAAAVPGATSLADPRPHLSRALPPEVSQELSHGEDAVRPARLSTLVGAVLGVLVLGAGALRMTEPGARPALVASAPSTAVTSTTQPPEPDAEPEPMSVDGTTVTVGARRYQVGEPGDVVVVGDWDGDAIPTLAVLRPTTGEVFVFDAWATDGDVVVEAVERVESAVDLMVEPGPDGDRLRVRRADGSWRPILTRSRA